MCERHSLKVFMMLAALFALLTGAAAYAQDATDEPTAEATLEATDEPTVEVTPEATDETRSAFPDTGRFAVNDVFDGVQRSYIVYIPDSYANADEAYPLIFVLHGAGGSGQGTENFTAFNDLADEENFIVVYPDGLGRVWNDGRQGDPRVAPVDDVGFMEYLIDFLSANLNIDTQRIYATGYSMGGMMSYRLGCESDRFAAVASVASTHPEYLLESCFVAPPIPVMVIQGTDDRVVPWVGVSGGYISAFNTVRFWAEHNECQTASGMEFLPDLDPEDGTLVIHESRTNCTDNADVELYGVYGGGHNWPGHPINVDFDLGLTTMDLDATAAIWEFFAAHERS
jgi:polyhydroxybutyrate depolymerase